MNHKRERKAERKKKKRHRGDTTGRHHTNQNLFFFFPRCPVMQVTVQHAARERRENMKDIGLFVFPVLARGIIEK